MRRLLPLLILLVSSLLGQAAFAEGHWPSFRGPSASGIGEGTTVTTWNIETGENVLWKTAIPGLGVGSPVIWGDRVFVTTAVSEKDDADLKVGLYGDIASADDNGVQSCSFAQSVV